MVEPDEGLQAAQDFKGCSPLFQKLGKEEGYHGGGESLRITPSRQVTALMAKMTEFGPGNLHKGERRELTCKSCSLISTYKSCCATTYHVH